MRMDIFERKNVRPMLIGATGSPEDNAGYIYELKFDGERCVMYADPATGCELKNKRQNLMLPRFPELADLHLQVTQRCILDGELVTFVDGRPQFNVVQKRSITDNRVKIEREARQHPATFVAFDLLYLGEQQTTGWPLEDRKAALQGVISAESNLLRISRWVPTYGTKVYRLAEEQLLEGVVAKRIGSRYVQGKRTQDWVKIKRMETAEYLVCGYVAKAKGTTSVILGEAPPDGQMRFAGSVSIGASSQAYKTIAQLPSAEQCVPGSFPDVSWVSPVLRCRVKYMMRLAGGGMRQAIFDGLI